MLFRSNLTTPRSCAIFNDRFNSLLVPVARDREVEMSEPALDPVRTPDHDSHSKPSRWVSTESAELSVDSSGYYASDSSCSAASCSTSKRTPVVISANRSENTTYTPTSKIAKMHEEFQTPSKIISNSVGTMPLAPKKVQHTIRIVASKDSEKPTAIRRRISKNEGNTPQSQAILDNELEDASPPPLKKRKIIGSRSFSKEHSTRKTPETTFSHLAPDRFSKRRASIRKAASLLSESSLQEEEPVRRVKSHTNMYLISQQIQESCEEGQSCSGTPISATPPVLCNEPINEFPSPVSVNTEPSTPDFLRSPGGTVTKLSKNRTKKKPAPFPEPIPIIAPPPFTDIPHAPASSDEVAELRLKAMLEKEQDERFDDGLDTKIAKAMLNLTPQAKMPAFQATSEASDDDMSEDEKQLWKDLPDLDDVMMYGDVTPKPTDGKRPKEDEVDDDPPPYLCIEDAFRQEIVEWMLDVCPFFLLPVTIPTRSRFYRPSHPAFLPSLNSVVNSVSSCWSVWTPDGMPYSLWSGTLFGSGLLLPVLLVPEEDR